MGASCNLLIRSLLLALLLALLLVMAACSSTPSNNRTINHKNDQASDTGSKAETSQRQRDFDKLQDSAPQNIPANVARVPDAVPEPVVRTRAGNKSPYTVRGKTYRVLKSGKGYRQRGGASWYGQKFHGRKTSNGETYDMFAMTAAHKTLPIPSFVRVTNLKNRRSVVVRVNDRGPFHPGRIIDLSYAAAAKLGFVNQGTAQVEVVDVTPAEPPMAVITQAPKPPLLKKPVWLQLGAFSSKESATVLGQRVASQPGMKGVKIQVVRGTDAIHRVRLGPLRSTARIEQLKRRLSALGVRNAYTVTP